MAVNGVTGNYYGGYGTESVQTKSTDTVNEKSSSVEGSSGKSSANVSEKGAVYEKGTESEKKASAYSNKKTTPEERARVIEQLKKADEERQSQLTRLVQSMLTSQGKTYSEADKWSLLASGDFKADAATVRKAKEDIGEDGYWGVKQTSQRLFDFAAAYAGDDVEKMKTMEKAMEKGFKLAGGQWGKKLPGICYDTMDATRALVKDWYKEHGVED